MLYSLGCWIGKMAQQVRELASQADDLSPIPRNPHNGGNRKLTPESCLNSIRML